MGKMSDRRRKKKKKLKKLANYMKSLISIRPRIPTPPTGSAFKSIKDYDRKQNKKAIDRELDENK
jgi:hypothetical protein